MEELSKLEEERRTGRKRGIASNEMCTFLIINISSLQLIPVNVIVYRRQYGSVNPAGIAVTAVSTLASIVFCKMMGEAEDMSSSLLYKRLLRNKVFWGILIN